MASLDRCLSRCHQSAFDGGFAQGPLSLNPYFYGHDIVFSHPQPPRLPVIFFKQVDTSKIIATMEQTSRFKIPTQGYTFIFRYPAPNTPQCSASASDYSYRESSRPATPTLFRPAPLELSFKNWDLVTAEDLKAPRNWARRWVWSLSAAPSSSSRLWSTSTEVDIRD